MLDQQLHDLRKRDGFHDDRVATATFEVIHVHIKILDEISTHFQRAQRCRETQQALVLEIIRNLWRLPQDDFEAIDIIAANRRDRVVFSPGRKVQINDVLATFFLRDVLRFGKLAGSPLQRRLVGNSATNRQIWFVPKNQLDTSR